VQGLAALRWFFIVRFARPALTRRSCRTLGVLLASHTTSALVVASYRLFSATASEITMTTSLEILEAEALKLAPADRSHLLERLVASLDVDPEVEEAWELEADRREASLESGFVAEIPAQEAMNRLRSRLAR